MSHWDIVSVFVDDIGKDFKFEIDENYIDILMKAKREAAANQGQLSIKDDPENDMLGKEKEAPQPQVSFLDQLLQDEKNEDESN